MASFNEILKSQEVRVSRVCTTGAWRETLSSADRAQFDAAVADPGIRSIDIFRAMKAMGYEGGDSAAKRHRTGGCRCSRTN